MIIVITELETNPRTGRMERVVSHGVDTRTDRVVVLPPLQPEQIGAIFDQESGEYVLPESR